MVKIDSGECIWEFAQKMQSSDMGLIRINLGLIQINPMAPKLEKTKKTKKKKQKKTMFPELLWSLD